jgi:hypothetical protein
MATTSKTNWKREPDEHDYPAAGSYLSLLLAPKLVEAIVLALQKAPIASYKAKDLLRASCLRLLAPDNVHVAKDLAKIERGAKLSPVLLVRGDLSRGWPLTVADGYHRICASYHTDENENVPCRITELPRA